MQLVLIFFALVMSIMAQYELNNVKKSTSVDIKTGGYSSSSHSLVNNYSLQMDERMKIDENATIARNADTAALRVCRQLSYEMRALYAAGNSACSGYASSQTLMSFIGTAGTTGSIDTLYSQTSSITLSCANPERYGRYLFSRALPQAVVAGKNVRFNLTNIVNGKSDPCGFREIIY